MIYTKANKFHVFTTDLESFRLVTFKQNGLSELNTFNLGNEVEILLYGTSRKISIEKLYFMYTAKMDFEYYYVDKVLANWELKVKKDIATHLSIPYVARFKVPITIVLDNKEFRIIPYNPTYAITKDGVIVHIPSKAIILHRKRKDDIDLVTYPKIKLGNKSFPIHRLVASAWVENDDWLNKVIVDHIDGNKANYNAANLRWVTTATNNLLKVEQGLHTQALTCYVKNLNNGVIKRYNSVTEFTKFYNIARINISMVKLGTDKPYIKKIGNSYYQLKYTDTDDWVSLPEAKALYKLKLSTMYIVNIDGKKYETLKDLSAFINNGKKYISLREALNYIANDMKFEYNIDYYEVPYKINFVAHNVVTDEVLYATTLKEFEEVTQNIKTNIYKSMNNDGAYIYNNWRFKHDNGDDFADAVNIQNKPKKIRIRNIHTKKDEIINSLREAARYLSVDKSTVKNYISTGKHFNNRYTISYLE